MNRSEWSRQLDEVQTTIARLEQRIIADPAASELLHEALEELYVTVEELSVSGEEIRQQQDELATAYVQAEVERARYRDLFEFAPDGYLVTDAQGKICEANRAAARLMNIGQEVLVGRLLLGFVVPEDQPDFLELLAHVSTGKAARVWNLRIQCHDAAPFNTSIVVQSFRDKRSSKVTGIRWLLRDVTAQVAQEEALRASEAALAIANATLEQRVAERTTALHASEERFRVVLHGSHVTVLQQDTDLRYTWIYNPAVQFEREEIVGKTSAEVMNRDDAERLDVLKRRVLETGVGLREIVSLTLNGKVVWYDLKVEPMRGADHTVVGITVVGTDITEYQRAAEAERFLGEVSNLLVTSLDPGSLLQNVSHLVAGRFADGCVFALPDGSNNMKLWALHHKDAARTEALRAWLEQGIHEQPEHPFWQAVHSTPPVYLSEGQAAKAVAREISASPKRSVPDSSPSMLVVSLMARNQVIGVMGLLNDQPGQRYTPDELQVADELARRVGLALDTTLSYDAALRARAEAENALRMRSQIFHIVSHDLRTPITTALGNTFLVKRELARLDQPAVERATRYAGKIEEVLDRLTEQINELLDVARLEASEEMALKRTPVDVLQLVQRLIQEIQQAYGSHQFHIEHNAASMTVEGDMMQLERVFTNLLSNAVKYSPKDSTVVVTFTTKERYYTHGALISIRDTGIGIPAEDLPYVFEPFRRGSNVPSHTSGTGVGLASARYVVEQHGGIMTVASEEGSGSTFSVWLPLAPERDSMGG